MKKLPDVFYHLISIPLLISIQLHSVLDDIILFFVYCKLYLLPLTFPQISVKFTLLKPLSEIVQLIDLFSQIIAVV